MSDIGKPLRRYRGVPREDPEGVPATWPPPIEQPEQAPVVDPIQPLVDPVQPLVPQPT